MAQRQGNAPFHVRRVPRLMPRPDAVLQRLDNLIADFLIDIFHGSPLSVLVAAAAATLPVGETGGSKGKEAPNAERRGSARGSLFSGIRWMRRSVLGCLARARGLAP
jgi:hypothetical protein